MSDTGRIIFIVVMVVLIVALIVLLLSKMFQFAIAVAVCLIVVPMLVTITWGDGSEYVSKFAAIFTPGIEESINEGYQYYREENEKDPVVDVDQLEEYANEAKDYLADKAGEVAEEAGTYIEDYLRENGFLEDEPSLDESMQDQSEEE